MLADLYLVEGLK